MFSRRPKSRRRARQFRFVLFSRWRKQCRFVWAHKMNAMHGILHRHIRVDQNGWHRDMDDKRVKERIGMCGAARAHTFVSTGVEKTVRMSDTVAGQPHTEHTKYMGRSWDGPVHVRARWRHQIRDEKGDQSTTEGDVRLKRIAKHLLDAPSCIQHIKWHTGTELSRRHCCVDNMGPSTSGGVLRSDSVELEACSLQASVGLACGRSRPDGVCTTSGRSTLRRYHHARDWKRTDRGAAQRFISKSRTLITSLKRQ